MHGYSWHWKWEGDVRVEESRKWAVADLLAESAVVLISGQWGTFKTFIGVDLAAAFMTGKPFINFPIVRQGGVAAVVTEGQFEIAVRVRAAYEARNGQGKAPFAWVEDSPRLLDENASDILVAMIKQVADKMQRDFDLPLVLVIVDPAGKAAGYKKAGDEQDSAIAKMIMKTLGDVARRTNTVVAAVMHFGKVAETGTRGSSAYEDDADVVLAALGERSIAGKISNTRLALRKRRTGLNGEEFFYRTKDKDYGLDPDGVPITTLTIEWLTGPQAGLAAVQTKADEWNKKTRRLLRQALMNVLVDHGKNIKPWADGPIVRAVDIEIVRKEFYKLHPAAEATDADGKRSARQKAFVRAINDAKTANLIGSWDDGIITHVWQIAPSPPEGMSHASAPKTAEPFRAVGDCPPETVCLACGQPKNVKKMVDGTVGCAARTLHEACAPGWFARRASTRIDIDPVEDDEL